MNTGAYNGQKNRHKKVSWLVWGKTIHHLTWLFNAPMGSLICVCATHNCYSFSEWSVSLPGHPEALVVTGSISGQASNVSMCPWARLLTPYCYPNAKEWLLPAPSNCRIRKCSGRNSRTVYANIQWLGKTSQGVGTKFKVEFQRFF